MWHESADLGEDEKSIGSIDEFNDAVLAVTDLHAVGAGVPSADHHVTPRYLWRGVGNSQWGLQSSLSRKFELEYGRWADEVELSLLETRVISAAREWNLDWQALGGRLGGLEFLARLQHHGVPTRLIDVTRSPIVALWFATENVGRHNQDGRIFIWDMTGSTVPEDWQESRGLPWQHQQNRANGDQQIWSATGEKPLAWAPPPLDDRMVGQAGAFLLGAVPANSMQRERSSVAFRPRAWGVTDQQPVHRGRGPVSLTFKVARSAKAGIIKQLERRYGISARVLFPDPDGFRNFALESLLDDPKEFYTGLSVEPYSRYLRSEWNYGHQVSLASIEAEITKLGVGGLVERLIRYDEGWEIKFKSAPTLEARDALMRCSDVYKVTT